MNDLTTALRELEAEAPDVDAMRAAVHQGIDTRARRKRQANIAGAALTVAALVAVAVGVGAGLYGQGIEPAATSDVVPIEIPDLVMPVDASKAGAGMPRYFEVRRGGFSSITYGSDTPRGFSVTVTATKPPRNLGEIGDPTEEDQISVNGRPATLRVYNAENGVTIFWREKARTWVSVQGTTVERTKEVANSLMHHDVRLTPPVDIGLAPVGYRFDHVGWSSPHEPYVREMQLCDGTNPGDRHCYNIDRYDKENYGQIIDGPEPDGTGRCDRDALERKWRFAFGKARTVDGASVRLNSDGCGALAVVPKGVRMAVFPQLTRDVQISPRDLARMAASITVR